MSNRRRRSIRRRVAFEIGTYTVILGILGISMDVSGGNLNSYILVLVLFLTAYTLLLVLPIRRFKLTLHSFEGELDELMSEADQSPPTVASEAIVDSSVISASYAQSTDPRVILLQLSVAIEKKLAEIAARHGLEKQSFNQVISQLKQREILTDRFVIDGLRFFREQRNALVHRGGAPELEKAIAVGRTLLAKLEEMQ